MKVLIGGGTGFLGRHLHKALLNRGHTVEIISRTKPKTGRYTWSQLEDEGSLPDCDALVNLSGEYILSTFRRWNKAYKRDVYESRVKLNELLVKLMVTGKWTLFSVDFSRFSSFQTRKGPRNLFEPKERYRERKRLFSLLWPMFHLYDKNRGIYFRDFYFKKSNR